VVGRNISVLHVMVVVMCCCLDMLCDIISLRNQREHLTLLKL